MNLSEPKWFEEANNPHHTTSSAKTTGSGEFSEKPPLEISKTVSIQTFDDFVDQAQQDYHLNKILKNKFQQLHSDKSAYASACNYMEIYLSYSYKHDAYSERIKAYALSNLNLI